MLRKTVLLLVVACLTAAALAEGSQLLPMPENEWASGIFTDGETLYIQADTLLTWREGDAEARTFEDKIDLPGPEDGDGSEWRQSFDGLTLFVDGQTLRGGRLLIDDDGEAEALQLCDAVLTDAGTVEARNVQTLNAPAAVRDGGLNGVSSLCVHEGVLYLLGYGNDGSVLCAVDSANPKSVRAQALDWDEYHLLPAPDGPILVKEAYDEGTFLYRVGADGSLDALCDLPPFTGGVAADPVTGDLYAELNGRVRPVDLDRGELGEPVSALPLDERGAAALGGGTRYVACMNGCVAVMSTESVLDEAGVMGWSASFNVPWLEEALLAFSVSHPELALARVEVPMENVLDGMLTQSRDADVLICDIGEGAAAFGALLNRGYMLPLERESLKAFGERLYPGIRRDMSSDGAFRALPVHLYGRGMGVSEALLARLGLSISDVPGDWMGFLTFLEEQIQPRLDQLGPDAGFTYADLSAEGFRYHLRMAILKAWENSAALAGVAPDYGDERLAALLEKAHGMDLAAFGLTESVRGDGDDWGDYGYSYGSGDKVLIQFSAPYGVDDDGVDGTPLLLGFGDDLPGAMAFDATAAFVNPYTAHPEAALDLMELLLERLPVEIQYTLCPDMTEPLLRPNHEAVKTRQEEMLAEFRAQLEAAEAKDVQALEEEIAAMEREQEEYERAGKWLISPERLEWYRAHGDRVCVQAPGWFEKDATGEAWQLLSQYTDGLIHAREFLSAVAQKARMMALEGD